MVLNTYKVNISFQIGDAVLYFFTVLNSWKLVFTEQ